MPFNPEEVVMHRIVVVTPAGRRKYLDLLKNYVLNDDSIDAWHLWDNCRNEADRRYIYELERISPKISIISIKGSDGSNASVNRFYIKCRDAGVFYIKMDDDIVYLPKDFGRQLYNKAAPEKSKYTWWSPLVVNNAICTWLLKYHGRVHIGNKVSAQAGCSLGWRSPIFAKALHQVFVQAATTHNLSAFQVPDFEINLTRFSINCIGFFGDFVASLTEAEFCPPGVDDEEWISAVLPSRVGKPGRIVGDIVISHFSYFTQEHALLCSNILNKYYELAGLQMDPSFSQISKESLRARLKRWLTNRLVIGHERPDIALLGEGEVPVRKYSKIPATIVDPGRLRDAERSIIPSVLEDK
jgi:hypothetical protein